MRSAIFVFALCALLLVVATDATRFQSRLTREKELFEAYITKHGKVYTPEEKGNKFANFQASLRRQQELQLSSPGAVFGPNMFSDMSKEEFYTSGRISKVAFKASTLWQNCLASGVDSTSDKLSGDLPTSFDWTTHNPPVVAPVKDQGSCGSCWAFSTVSNIESLYALKGKNLTLFSEQMLVDCSKGCCEEGGEEVCNEGCDGGWPWTAMGDVITWKGIATEESYPYKARDMTCNMAGKKLFAPIRNYTCLSGPNSANEDEIAAQLMKIGPLSIGINADYLQDYWYGIINPSYSWECDPDALDHAVNIVGFGEEKGVKYWTIRNSWGTSWGEKGNFRILRGSGTCGVNNAVTSAVL